MAGGTIIHDARMVEHAGREAAGFVTNATILGGHNVVDFHAQGRHAIVA